MMKLSLYFFLLLTLASCTSSSNQNSQKLVRANQMDFPQLEQRVHDKVKFKLSKLFDNSFYSQGLTIQDKSFERAIYDMSMYFSVESFNENYINKLRFLNNDTTENLNLIHSYYIDKRASTLNNAMVSVRKNVSKSVGFPGYIQVVEGSSYSSTRAPESTYLISSIAIDKKIFVFQLIGPKKNMGYFYDDFQRILNSIEK